jgi:hypothetical protein
MAGSGPIAGLTAPSPDPAGSRGGVLMAASPYMSRTMSPLGWAQQMSTSPSAGGSSGAGA